MASVLQTLIDGPRNLVIKATGTNAVTAETIVDVSSYVPACTRVRIMKVTYQLDSGMTGILLWDADTDVTAITLAAGSDGDLEFWRYGGLVNNASTGVNGDIKLTTTGTGNYSLVLEMFKAGTIDLDNY